MITLRHTTLGRTLLDEWSARRRDLYLTTRNTHNRHPRLRQDSNPRATPDLRLIQSSHWDRHLKLYGQYFSTFAEKGRVCSFDRLDDSGGKATVTHWIGSLVNPIDDIRAVRNSKIYVSVRNQIPPLWYFCPFCSCLVHTNETLAWTQVIRYS